MIWVLSLWTKTACPGAPSLGFWSTGRDRTLSQRWMWPTSDGHNGGRSAASVEANRRQRTCNSGGKDMTGLRGFNSTGGGGGLILRLKPLETDCR